MQKSMTRRIAAVLVAGALVSGLAGCSLMSNEAGGEAPPTASQTPADSSAPATTPATPPASTPAETGQPSPSEPPASEDTCSNLSGEEALTTWVDQVPPAIEGSDFVWDPEQADPNTYDPCAPLSWIVLPIEGGTASSPYQIMLFHSGDYIGTTAEKAYGFWPEVIRLDTSSIEVTYSYPQGGDSNANPSGSAVATFTWNDETQSVDLEGELPPR